MERLAIGLGNTVGQILGVDIMECPKCEAEIEDGSVECPECGVIVAKFRKRKLKQGKPASTSAHRTEPKPPSVTIPILIVMAIVAGGYWAYLSLQDEPAAEKPVAVQEAKPENKGTVDELRAEKDKEKMDVEDAIKKIDKLVGFVPGGGMKKKMAGE